MEEDGGGDMAGDRTTEEERRLLSLESLMALGAILRFPLEDVSSEDDEGEEDDKISGLKLS